MLTRKNEKPLEMTPKRLFQFGRLSRENLGVTLITKNQCSIIHRTPFKGCTISLKTEVIFSEPLVSIYPFYY
jgi:hypothetical protein